MLLMAAFLRFFRIFLFIFFICGMTICECFASPVTVRYKEGLTHGFLVVRNEDGKIIAGGEVEQTVHGSVVTSTVRFHFKDGSLHEETTVFSQAGTFKVLSDHLLEKGPAFKDPMEVWIDRAKSQVRVREMKDGKDKITTHHLALPDDLANGIIPTVIKNFTGNVPETVTMVAATPNPRIVKLVFTLQGEDTFSFEGTSLKAKHYVMKVQVGGVAGVVAPLVGKQPHDSEFWVLGGDAPTFLKSKGPISDENPVWQIELATPSLNTTQ